MKKLIHSPPQYSQPYLTTDFAEFDFKKILKHTLIQQDYQQYHPQIIPGKQEELPRFISENREKLYAWFIHNPTLKLDLENIDIRKKMLIGDVDEMLGHINFLLSTWKMTYYLTEEDLQIPEWGNVI